MRLIAALLTLVFACTSGARASFTYTFADVAYDAGSVAAHVVGGLDPTASNHGGFYITVSNAAVARGSFVLHASGTGALGNPLAPGFLYTGDLADLVVFNDREEQTTASSNIGTLDLNLAFDSNGDVSTGKVDHTGISEEVHLSGSSNHFYGFFGSDNAVCHYFVLTCGVSGRLVATDPVDVPEPNSLAGLLAAIFACSLFRLRPSRARAASRKLESRKARLRE